MVFFLFSNQDIKSGQSPLMHAVESNNADMVHFLIEVMRVCGERMVVSQLYLISLVFPLQLANYTHNLSFYVGYR